MSSYGALVLQYIFASQNFDSPLFLTYFSTSLFTLYLSGFCFRQDWRNMYRGQTYCTSCAADTHPDARARALFS